MLTLHGWCPLYFQSCISFIPSCTSMRAEQQDRISSWMCNWFSLASGFRGYPVPVPGFCLIPSSRSVFSRLVAVSCFSSSLASTTPFLAQPRESQQGDNYRTMDLKPLGNCWAGNAEHVSIRARGCSAAQGKMEPKEKNGEGTGMAKAESPSLKEGKFQAVRWFPKKDAILFQLLTSSLEICCCQKGLLIYIWEFHSCGSLKSSQSSYYLCNANVWWYSFLDRNHAANSNLQEMKEVNFRPFWSGIVKCFCGNALVSIYIPMECFCWRFMAHTCKPLQVPPKGIYGQTLGEHLDLLMRLCRASLFKKVIPLRATLTVSAWGV